MTRTDFTLHNDLLGEVSDAFAARRKPIYALGVILFALGVLAVALPIYSTLFVGIFIGWIFIIAGIVRFLWFVRLRDFPGYWWLLISSILFVVLGLLIVARPMPGLLTLTLLLTFVFSIEGAFALLAALDLKKHSSGWIWILISGLVNFALVALILSGLPATASWILGIFAGVNLIFFGFSLVMFTAAIPRKSPH